SVDEEEHVMMDLVAICLSIALAVTLPQEKPADRQPQKGDSIVVKGCLKGRSLESTETGFVNSDALSLTALVYRLSGDKNLLKQMHDQHDNSVVEVTGTLKSNLPPADGMGGMTIGKTRVRIGTTSVGSGTTAEAGRSLPVLEVKSYEG